MSVELEPVAIVPADRKLESARCVLRRPLLSDAQAILATIKSPGFPRDLPLAQLQSLEAIERSLRHRQEGWAKGSRFDFCVERRGEDELLGIVQVVVEPEPHTWALGFWLRPTDWGRGYATECSRAVIDFAFAELGATDIRAGTALSNHASQAVLAKLGFVFKQDDPDGYRFEHKPVATREYLLRRREA